MVVNRRGVVALILSNLLTVYVRLRGEQITLFQAGELLYKHASGQLPSVFVNYFTPISQMNPYNLRSSGNYRPVYSRTNTRKFSIKHIGPRAWKSIPLDIRSSLSFKKGCGNT